MAEESGGSWITIESKYDPWLKHGKKCNTRAEIAILQPT